jgi:hypothetical protein
LSTPAINSLPDLKPAQKVVLRGLPVQNPNIITEMQKYKKGYTVITVYFVPGTPQESGLYGRQLS